VSNLTPTAFSDPGVSLLPTPRPLPRSPATACAPVFCSAKVMPGPPPELDGSKMPVPKNRRAWTVKL